jgi:hypothetical protein
MFFNRINKRFLVGFFFLKKKLSNERIKRNDHSHSLSEMKEWVIIKTKIG